MHLPFDVNNGTVLLAGQNGVPRSIMYTDYNNFSPRAGFAYLLHNDGKAVFFAADMGSTILWTQAV